MSPIHVVRPGECLLSICQSYGFTDWKQVYDDPGNEPLRKKRPDPNLLAPGDRVVIPEKTVKTFEIATGQTHTYKVKVLKARLRLKVHQHLEGETWSGQYELDIPGMPSLLTGTIGGDGLVDVEVPVSATAGTLTILKDGNVLQVFKLELGGMAPADSIAGVQSRLKHLGFDCGAVDGVLGGRTRRALAVFRARYGLAEPEDGGKAGDVDAATSDKLKELCGT